jgi:DNA-binding transcriptional ArsR family regulator
MAERGAHKHKAAPERMREINGRVRDANTRLRAVKRLARGGASSDFDGLIHERLRLAIVSALAVHEWLSFNELKEMLQVSDGNLSVHARKLEEAGYLSCSKTFEGRVPKTRYKLTAAGRTSLERHLAHLEALIKTVRER